MVKAVNGTIPGPPIVVYVDQLVKVHIRNMLLSDSTTIHFHGLHQKETPYFDGMPYITQCPIAAGQTFTHEFKVGTFILVVKNCYKKFFSFICKTYIFITPKFSYFKITLRPRNANTFFSKYSRNLNISEIFWACYTKNNFPIIFLKYKKRHFLTSIEI